MGATKIEPVRLAVIGAGLIGKRHAELVAAHGSFLLVGICDVVPSDILKRYEIDPKAKVKLRADLRMMGVQEATAFPDLDGLARELAELY